MDKLKEWRRLSSMRLASNQNIPINYTIQEIYSWTLATLSETVNLLVTTALNFHNLKLDETQTLITKYFAPRLYDNDESN